MRARCPYARFRQGRPPIVRHAVNACWYIFKTGAAVAIVGAVAVGVYMYARMDDEIRRQVESFLSERYPHLNVNVGGARIVDGKGIAIYDLSLADPSGGGRDDRLLSVDELMLVCDVKLAKLVQGSIDVHRVEIKHPQVWARRATTGRWNLESLLPWTPCGNEVPQIIIRDGVLSLSDDSLAEAQPLVVRDAALTCTPTQQPAAPGEWPSVRIEGMVDGPHVKRVEIHAAVDGPRKRCTATLTIDHLQANELLSAWLKPRLPPSLRASSATGVLDGTATFAWQAGGAEPPLAEAALTVSDGRLEDPRLPRPLTDLAGSVTLDRGQLRVTDLRGKWGEATVAASLNRNGWGETAPMTIAARVQNVPLDELTYQAMPLFLRREWDKYRPAGMVDDATLEAAFDGSQWKPNASLTGSQLSFQDDKFAYRLTGGSGKIKFTAAEGSEPAHLTLKLVGVGGGQPLQITGEVIDPRPEAAGWMEVVGKDVDIETRMIDAMQPKAREVITSLRPTGKFNLYFHVERKRAGEPSHTTLQLALTDVQINYEKFPYPLSAIKGLVTAEDNNWTFSQLVSGGRRIINGEGYLRPTAAGSELSLELTGQQVPLDDDLFDALPPPVQHAWAQLHPHGLVDLRAEVLYHSGDPKPVISVAVQPRPEASQLRPEFFPYRMDNVSGTINYKDGEVALHNVQVLHDRTRIQTNGSGFFSPEGDWQFTFTGLTADRVTPQQELVAALPKQLGKLVDELQPTGSFSVSNGTLGFRKSASPLAAVESQWDLQLDCDQTDLRCGIQLENIHGSVRLVGHADGARTSTAGELALETVTFQNVQFTNVTGPLWVDESQCRLGRLATGQQLQTPRSLTANVYGGTAAADAWVTFSGLPKYGAAASFTGLDLNRLMLERFGGHRQFTGKIDGNVSLGGEGVKVESLEGHGDAHVHDANIYELPLWASIVKLLKVGSSDTTAFNESQIKFRLQGPHIYLDQLDFLGDAVNLYGKGETNFDQRLNLVLSAEAISRDRIPLIHKLMGPNSGLVLINVDGTFADPHVTTEAFSGINQAIKQMRADLKDPLGSTAQRQALRQDAVVEPANR